MDDKTVFLTPQPAATSTANRKKKPNHQNFNKTEEDSLGILSIASDIDLFPTLEPKALEQTPYKVHLDIKHQSACTTKSSAPPSSLPSRFLKPSEATQSYTSDIVCRNSIESSVNESDLLRSSNFFDDSFRPPEISTPRTSEIRFSENYEALLKKYKNSNISISDFCKETQGKLSGKFTPGELAVETLTADERLWKNQRGIPGDCKSDFSRSESFSGGFDPKVSMGEFFLQKSEDIRKLMPTESPEKQTPVALVDETQERSLSISSIQKVLSEINVDDTPSRVLNLLTKPNTKARKSENSKENVREPETVSKSNRNSCYSQKSESSSLKAPGDKSVTSVRSTSSLSNLVDGKLPIQSSKIELTWPCVKLGKSVTETFVLRNRSQNRLRIQAIVTGYDFKLLKERTEIESSTILRITLHPLESRSITVVFSPSNLGASVGKINFIPDSPDLQQTKKQQISLFGYGGHFLIDVHSITKDTRGKFLLSLGDIHKSVQIRKQFTVQNSGALPGFVYLAFEPRDAFWFTSVSVEPQKLVLKPRESQTVTVTYVRSKEDLRQFTNAVSNIRDVGIVKLCTGAEALRGRIRKLVQKAAEKHLEIKPLTRELAQNFPSEVLPKDLGKISESVAALEDLCQHLVFNEVVLIVERDLDSTVISLSDNTTMFHTLTADQSNSCSQSSFTSLKVEPATIVLTPPVKTEDTLLVTCDKLERVNFEIVCQGSDIMVAPKGGCMEPGETVVVKVKCAQRPTKDVQIYALKVLSGNEVVEVELKVVYVKQSGFKHC